MSTVFQYLMSFNQLMSTDFIASISRVMYGVREETLCFYHIFTVYFLFILYFKYIFLLFIFSFNFYFEIKKSHVREETFGDITLTPQSRALLVYLQKQGLTIWRIKMNLRNIRQ